MSQDLQHEGHEAHEGNEVHEVDFRESLVASLRVTQEP